MEQIEHVHIVRC